MSGARRSRKQERREKVRAREAERAAAAKGKDCYCGPEDRFCATCGVCGRPGHLRHFPGAAPVTGAWCEWHYRRLKVLHPNGSIGCWLYLSMGVAGLAALLRVLM